MPDAVVARAGKQDVDKLRRLWSGVFGDPPELIDAFFQRFPPEETAWIVRRGTELCSAAYAIPGNRVVSGNSQRNAVYVYAVATFPEHRGNGYAGMLLRELYQSAEKNGAILYTRPADSSLFSMYQKEMSAGCTGFMTEEFLVSDAGCSPFAVEKIDPQTYGDMREIYYGESPHIALSDPFLCLQERYSDGFYSVDGCAACCAMNDGALYIFEMLCDAPERSKTVDGLLRFFGANQAVLRQQSMNGSVPLIAHTGIGIPDEINWGLLLE